MVRKMWEVYSHNREIRLPRFWREAFEAAYEELASDEERVRAEAILEIARMSMQRSLDLESYKVLNFVKFRWFYLFIYLFWTGMVCLLPQANLPTTHLCVFTSILLQNFRCRRCQGSPYSWLNIIGLETESYRIALGKYWYDHVVFVLTSILIVLLSGKALCESSMEIFVSPSRSINLGGRVQGERIV